jgi:hypothetical protein
MSRGELGVQAFVAEIARERALVRGVAAEAGQPTPE